MDEKAELRVHPERAPRRAAAAQGSCEAPSPEIGCEVAVMTAVDIDENGASLAWPLWSGTGRL
jgi:hypothetical protein